MNLIAIDPSLVSTAVCINGKLFNYCKEDIALTKSGLTNSLRSLTKWFKLFEHLIEYKYLSYEDYSSYSDGEIKKIQDYDAITNMIIIDIHKNII